MVSSGSPTTPVPSVLGTEDLNELGTEDLSS